jgi:hypothetical protein
MLPLSWSVDSNGKSLKIADSARETPKKPANARETPQRRAGLPWPLL